MKSRSLAVVLLASIGLFTPAIAGRTRPVAKKKTAAIVDVKAKKPNLGESYDLFSRSTKVPTATIDSDEIVYDLRPVTQAQISTEINEHLGELEYCWSKIPAAKRDGSCTAMLKFSIEPDGKVTGVKVTGDAPPIAARCITAAASRWAFATSEARADVEYPLAMRSL